MRSASATSSARCTAASGFVSRSPRRRAGQRPPLWRESWGPSGSCGVSGGPLLPSSRRRPVSSESDTLVFVPAWNEQESLPAVLRELHADLADAEVLVVDDGSTDLTADVARKQGVDVLSFGENRGLPAAIA